MISDNAWLKFEREVLPSDCIDLHRREVRKAFYAGFFSCFQKFRDRDFNTLKNRDDFINLLDCELQMVAIDPNIFECMRKLNREMLRQKSRPSFPLKPRRGLPSK